jgi:hypothetical protein
MSEYSDKLKTLGFGTKVGEKPSERRRITDERDGSVAGVETEHWDGSQDAAARPKAIRVRAQLVTEEER